MVELGQQDYFLVHGQVVLVTVLYEFLHEFQVGESVDAVPVFGDFSALDGDVVVMASGACEHPV